MLTDEQVEEYYKKIIARIDAVNDAHLKMVGDQIQKIGELSSTSVNRIAQMQKYGAQSAKLKRDLAKALRNSQSDIKTLYENALRDETHNLFFAMAVAGKDIADPTKNSYLRSYIEAVANQTFETFDNWSNTSVIDQNYQQIVSDGIDAVSRGVSDYRSVIRRSIKKFGGSGLQVEYESGVHRRLDSAIRQNILDGTRQISQQCAKQIGAEIGADGVELSAHPYSALDHEPCQGRQYTNEQYDRMQSGQNFVDVDGNQYAGFERRITQWNCRHFASPILIGISKRRYTDAQLEEWKRRNHEGCEIDGQHFTIYQASQLMRKIELDIRKQKDIYTLAKASGDEVAAREAQYQITLSKAQYKKVAEASGLKARYDKMSIVKR